MEQPVRMAKYLILLIMLTLLMAVAVNAGNNIDYKARFIIKLIHYVTWPDGAKTDANGNISIYIVGTSPITAKLKTLVAEKNQDSPPIVVKEVSISDNIADCQILFIATQETSDLAKILKKVNGTTALTVSDADYFANYGVMINFFSEDSGGKAKTKFEVNKTVVDMAGLKISSKLLKLAKII